MRALIQRINRVLSKENETLKKSRGMQAFLDLGDYYAIDVNRNYVSAKHIDPEKWGRELGVLKDFEVVVE